MKFVVTEEFWSNPSVVSFVSGTFMVLVTLIPFFFHKQKNNKTQHLEHHPFFDRSESIKHHIDMTFTLDNKGKELVFKEILVNQITIYQKYLHQLCIELDQERIDNPQILFQKCMKTIDDMTYEHYHYYKHMSSYSRDEVEVLDKVMKKYVIWNTPNIDLLQQNIAMICASTYCTDIQTQGAVIMDLFCGILVNSLGDAVTSLNTINGDLKGHCFRGVTIQ